MTVIPLNPILTRLYDYPFAKAEEGFDQISLFTMRTYASTYSQKAVMLQKFIVILKMKKNTLHLHFHGGPSMSPCTIFIL